MKKLAFVKNPLKKQFLIPLITFLFLFIGTAVAVLYGRGYRLGGFNQGRILTGTGLLVATSTPDSAQVFINGHLTTATNNTINLAPGTYTVKIFKDGYFPWEKNIIVQKEVVAKAEALLFPQAPKLESVTTTGVQNPVIDPTMSKIAYIVASQSARKNGVFVLDMNSRPILALQGASVQLADDTADTFSKATTLSWSPDGQELLASISADPTLPPTLYLLKTSGFNQTPQDVTATIETVRSSWKKVQDEKDKALFGSIDERERTLVKQNFRILSWSPDETKVLYLASVSATLPPAIVPGLIGTNSTKEERSIKKDNLYIYDLKEDKNFSLLGAGANTAHAFSWFSDSKHIIYTHDKRIDVLEYDGSNLTTIYAGPFLDSYVFPWVGGSRITILTNLGNPDIPPNLYTIGIK